MNCIFKVRGTDILATDTPQQYHEKLARIALDEMYQFVAVLDAKGTLLEVNRAALEGGGLKLSDVEGKPFWECFWWGVSKETQETLRQAVGRASQGEFIRYDAEVYGRAHGKETIIIDFSMIPVKDEAGNVVFIVPEGRDITEKKAYEQEIAKKNKDLQALLERIRELDEIKTQFFANVSHELRTPLALIIGPADRLLKEDAEVSFEQRRESAHIIGRNARMLLKHVNDLLDISKLEAGKLKLEARDADIGSLVRFTASHFELLARDRQIAFLVESQTQVISAIDPEKIQRVMMNLLSNAFKFVPDGGTVRASIGFSKNELTISVEDSGLGVKPELRRAIFERFRQGEGGANRQFGGTGLGLAIAKEFVEMHKGTIEILDSNLGGACFRVTLPTYRLPRTAFTPALPLPQSLDQVIVEGFVEELRASPYQKAGESIPPINSGKQSVLVVEDNPEMNRFIAESLSEKYNVISAFDGQEGLEKALVSNPTLIVTDIMMPKVSGVQMIAEMRKHPELADVPILLLTAKADEDLKIKLLEESAQDFVAKPFSERDLLVRVRNLIELKKSQERHRTLFKSMDEGFCTIEVIFDDNNKPVDYCFLEVNGAFEKQTGLKEARGKRMRELAPRHEQHWFDIYGKIALTGESTRFENRAEALGRWYEVYAFRVGLSENRQVAIFFNDITARKEAEKLLEEARQQLIITNEQLSKTNEDLEQRVEKRTASLSEAIAQMEEFSYTVSHDMRAPLRGMVAYSNVLLKDADKVFGANPEAVEYLQRIAENAARLDKMVLDVLTFSRAARREVSIDRVPIDKLIRDLVMQYPGMQPPVAEIQIEPLSDVLAHEPSLIQVISNLLTNAVKFTAVGSIPKVRIWMEKRDHEVRLWVEDNGIGIDPRYQHRLFRMFERLHPKLDYEGTGVGLAIVRKAAERMNGKVGVESDGKNGSKFWIQLSAPKES